jgi:hypothetical protein
MWLLSRLALVTSGYAPNDAYLLKCGFQLLVMFDVFLFAFGNPFFSDKKHGMFFNCTIIS